MATSRLGRIVLGAEEVACLKEASRKIFGNLPHSKGPSGNKLLRKPLIGDKIVTYYKTSMNRIGWVEWKGEYVTPRQIHRANQLKGLYNRENPPTKKGQGKRSQGKKKN